GHGGSPAGTRPTRRAGPGRRSGAGRPVRPQHRGRGPVPGGGRRTGPAFLAVPLPRHDHRTPARVDAPGIHDGRRGGPGEAAMNQRNAFLKALAKNEDDTATRLVYADWLDEHGEHEEADRQRKWPAAKEWLVRL